MSDSNNNNDGNTQSDTDLPTGAKWLKKPSDVQFFDKAENEFTDDTPFFFTGLHRATDTNIAMKRLYSLCLFQVSHLKYKPASNKYGSGMNNGNKDGNIERIIWLVDVFGITGYNMAAIVLQRGQSDSILFGNDLSMRDNQKAGGSDGIDADYITYT